MANELKPFGTVTSAWNTRPTAPVDGLERYDISMFGNGAVEMCGGEYVRFDQAEAIIAAKDADNAALTARVKVLEGERDHWKANHDCVVGKYRLATQRPDLPVDRLPAIRKLEVLEAQLATARKALTDIQCIDWDGLSVSDVFDEINEIVERAALEVKP